MFQTTNQYIISHSLTIFPSSPGEMPSDGATSGALRIPQGFGQALRPLRPHAAAAKLQATQRDTWPWEHHKSWDNLGYDL